MFKVESLKQSKRVAYSILFYPLKVFIAVLKVELPFKKLHEQTYELFKTPKNCDEVQGLKIHYRKKKSLDFLP